MAVSAVAVPSAPGLLTDIVRTAGSASHPWPLALARADRPSPRDLSDVIHHLLTLHGRQPGMIDLALARADEPVAAWLEEAATAFAEERAYLNRLAVAAGPLPSTPGHAQAEAAVLAQCHAFEMLSRSDRNGCACGAALALVSDWRAIRSVLDAAATRLGVPFTSSALADPDDMPTSEGMPSVMRAIRFGAEQVLEQHRRLWDLLESRAQARAH